MLQLKDIFQAPLDAAYESMSKRNGETNVTLLQNNFQIVDSTDVDTLQEYGGTTQTVRPLEREIQFKNKHGRLQSMKVPSLVFEQATTLNVRDLMIDFDVNISEMRRRTSDGALVVNASLQKPSGDKSNAIQPGGFHFNVTYRNELPKGITKLQEIFADLMDEKYSVIKDRDDLELEQKDQQLLHQRKSVRRIELLTESIHELMATEDPPLEAQDRGERLSLALQQTKDLVEMIGSIDDVGLSTQLYDMLIKLPTIEQIVDKGILSIVSEVPEDDIYVIKYVDKSPEHLYSIDRVLHRKYGAWEETEQPIHILAPSNSNSITS